MIQVNLFLGLILAALALSSGASFALARLNARNLRQHGREVPREFQGEIDEATLAKMTDYTLESSRFAQFENIFGDLVLFAVILSGLFPGLAGLLSSKFAEIPAGLAFFGVLWALSAALDLPFSIYGTFVIERKYGFSTITWRMWLLDLVKSAVVSVAIAGSLLAAFLALLYKAPWWWLWAWLFFSAFQFLMLWLYPVLIAPLFNKFEPLEDEVLRERIVSLMERSSLHVQGVYQVDVGKRSRHTNAYFTGIGRTKRIVLYDTLLQSHTVPEVLAVLAHEAGHWRRRHVLKQVVLMQGVALVVLFASAALISERPLYEAFGFNEVVPYAGLLLAGIALRPLAFFFTPVAAGISRRFERQADSDACALAPDFTALAEAFKRLAKDNLANLHPHPLYAWFYYSHPPLLERIRSIMSCKKDA